MVSLISGLDFSKLAEKVVGIRGLPGTAVFVVNGVTFHSASVGPYFQQMPFKKGILLPPLPTTDPHSCSVSNMFSVCMCQLLCCLMYCAVEMPGDVKKWEVLLWQKSFWQTVFRIHCAKMRGQMGPKRANVLLDGGLQSRTCA